MRTVSVTIKKADVTDDNVIRRILDLEKRLDYFNFKEASKNKTETGKWLADFKLTSHWDGAFERLKEYVNKKSTIALIAVRDTPLRVKEYKRIIGFVTGEIVDRPGSKIEKAGDISLLLILNTYRSKNLGIGTKLMKKLFKVFKEEYNIRYITVYAYANNHRAIRFYKGFGFTPLDHGFLLKL